MKITLYTITDCEFCKQEKEYLQSHNLPFEEKNLEKNKEWLTEMLAVSNNFAGTPVTKVEKDDGSIAVLKGFTKEEFDQTLGFAQAATATPTPPKAEEPAAPPAETPVPPPVETPPPVEVPPTETPATPPPAETPTPPPAEPPAAPSQNQEANDALNSILQDLQAKSAAPSPGPATPTMTGAVPHPDSEPPPAVPDFQAKT